MTEYNEEWFRQRILAEAGADIPRSGVDELSEEERRQLLLAESQIRLLGRALKKLMPSGWGFTLHMFQFGPGGGATYISSAERRDVIKMLRELAGALETGQL